MFRYITLCCDKKTGIERTNLCFSVFSYAALNGSKSCQLNSTHFVSIFIQFAVKVFVVLFLKTRKFMVSGREKDVTLLRLKMTITGN